LVGGGLEAADLLQVDDRADDANEHQAVIGVELHLWADGRHDFAFALDLGEESIRQLA
jgi:hypothetical protein